MLTNQSGWRFEPAGDFLEVYVPEKYEDRLDHPEAPYEVVFLGQHLGINEIKRVIKDMTEYS